MMFFKKGTLSGPDGPARHGSCRLFDILFRIVADTEREEFHQFTSEIFIRVIFAIRIGIEPKEHRWVANHLVEEFAKRIQSVASKELILPTYPMEIVDFEIAGRKMIMPHPCHLFAKWIRRKQATKDPPGSQSILVIALGCRLAESLGHRQKVIALSVDSRSSFKQSCDALLGSVSQVALKFEPSCSKTSAAVKVFHAIDIPWLQ